MRLLEIEVGQKPQPSVWAADVHICPDAGVVETTGEAVLKVGYEDATDAKTNWDLAIVMSVIPAKAGIQKE